MAPSPIASDRPTLGLVLPTFPQRGGRAWADLAGAARAAEDHGAAALWACDHLFWPTENIDCFVALAAAAPGTTQCALGTAVVQLPLRDTAVVAKQVGSLDAITGGRFVLGLGVGQHDGEYAKVGAPYRTRGRDLDAGIAAVRRHLTDDEGRYPMLPAPGPVPLWFGGSSEAVLHRTATVGDGWMPLFIPPDRLERAYADLADRSEAAGRGRDTVTRSTLVFVSVGDTEVATARGLEWMGSLYGLPGEKFARHLVAGPAEHCADRLRAYFAAGAAHVALFVADDDPVPQFAAIAAARERIATG